MTSTSGERQIGRSYKEIAPDHINRYIWAAKQLKQRLPMGGKVLDAACGCAYGSAILADAGFQVTAIDLSREAMAYAAHFIECKDVTLRQEDLMELDPAVEEYDAVVTLETIEHLPNPTAWVTLARMLAPVVVASVPNEEVIPWTKEGFPFHTRHFTPNEFGALFNGWVVEERGCQIGKWEANDVRAGWTGRNLVAVASRPSHTHQPTSLKTPKSRVYSVHGYS